MNTLLHILQRQQGRWLTMEALQNALAMSPADILREVHRLHEQQGYHIETSPMYGFRLAGVTDRLDVDEIEEGLPVRRIGRKVIVYEETDSTNDVAWAHAATPGYDGLAVFAERQRKGRGRLGRHWVAPLHAGLLGSVLLQDEQPDLGPRLSVLAGLAAAEGIRQAFAVDTQIKWPNDIIYEHRKLAGIMIESRAVVQGGAVVYVVGIGINCRQNSGDFPPALSGKAVSLEMILREPVDRHVLARELLIALDRRLEDVRQHRLQLLHDAWLRRCGVVGKPLTLISDGRQFTGRVVDVSVTEGLLLRLDSGGVKVFDPATTTVALDEEK